ncbi:MULTISPECIES: CaiB/BaiF CoA transferase family protein [unclassified Sphingomonas]|uniref:CaiB/BaiF CoA transferase family protein n=1 Tax=unclassified Sphingomonas TaxID=196159 RepID=UPI0006FC66D5|nr:MULTISPECIES: CaiB/BaiF CoA-transferase family protein [unclassified Sphingomonas]KQX25660.1 carnitine dehydratase [Sphingomonas sp. Root1294]KQY66651.1 carnitine dehydratase [Sphingomonas sp. Root50]KRB90026.1 carnitine dehydratase [Sphingomonas sp. Root720]
MASPLSDILVVSVEQAVAAPLCSARLADAGARVIKVERPEGDFARDYDRVVNGGSAYFDWLNRGKESVRLDFKKDSDAALLAEMIDRADIFIQNLAPGAAERSGFGSAMLRQRNPRLITCDISGYGLDGPLKDRKAYDLLIQCESGLASITGTPDAPGRVGISIVDLTCGLNAYSGILEALLRRERTGCGASLSISLFDSVADWMAVPLLHHDYGGSAPSRVGIAHPSIVPYGVFRCADAKDIVIAIQNEREWTTLVRQVLGEDQLLSDDRYSSNSARTSRREEVDAIIAGAFARRSATEMAALLDEARIAFAMLNDVSGLSLHPHLRRISVDSPEGVVSLPAPPVRWTDWEIGAVHVPALGEHDQAIEIEFTTSQEKQAG